MRPGKGLGQKKDVRIFFLDLADRPFPEPNALVCGLSTRKTRTPCSIQNCRHPSAPPTIPATRGSRNRADNVLIFLGRIFRVLDGAVGPLPEPFGMFSRVGVIGRALERDVQSDLEPMLLGLGDSRSKSSSVPSSDGWPYGRLPSIRSPRGCLRRPGCTRIILAFPAGVPDRVDGRQVQNIEAHRCDIGEPDLAVP